MTLQFARRTPRRLSAFAMVALAGTALTTVGLRQALADGGNYNATQNVQKDFKPIQSFEPLVQDVKPAVVSVTVHLKVQNAAAQQEGSMHPGLPFPFPFPFHHPQHAQPVEAKGSGFFINSKGYIVTNNHVVKHAKSVFVTLSDGQRLPAKVIGTDPGTDLAVIKVSRSKPFHYLNFSNASKVKPGQWVVAMGNPFGLAETATAGIVSALNRYIGDGQYDTFIQTDAPINEGNSGGPLLNQQGEVIGVDTAILSPSGGSVGIGFAIQTTDHVQHIIHELMKTGHVVRGFIGVSVQPLTPQMAQAMGVNVAHGHANGALIAAVEPNSPASKAGLKPGDVITQVDGNAVKTPRDLALAISEIKPGGTAHLTYLRNGKTEHTSATVEKMPANPNAAFTQSGQGSTHLHQKPELGLTLAPLTSSDRAQLNLPSSLRGALISHVAPNSPADEAGLRSGDVVVGVGSTRVTSPDAAVDAIHKAEKHHNKAVALRVMRGDQALFVAVPLGKSKG